MHMLRLEHDLFPPTQSPASSVRDFPLSYAQQRLWLIDQVQGTQAVVVRLQGLLNAEALERSLREVISRHEVLRTTFPLSSNGEPVQRVSSDIPFALEIADLRNLGPTIREERAWQYIDAAVRCRFDLEHGPLVRSLLVQQSDDEQLLLLMLHEMVCDRRSVEILSRELSQLYAAYNGFGPSPLPLLSTQFADFAVSQRSVNQQSGNGQQIGAAASRPSLSYWKRNLAGNLPVLELPTDQPRPPARSFRRAVERFSLPLELKASLEQRGASQGATLFMTLLAAFKTVLWRYTGQTDMIVGSPVDARSGAANANLIGQFTNLLALRTDLAGNPTFRDLLDRVRVTTLLGYKHQDCPFEQVLAELKNTHPASHSPVFQVLFELTSAAAAPLQLAGLQVQACELEGGRTQFDLGMVVTDSASGLQGQLEYNSELFSAGQMTRLVGHFETLLAAVARSLDQRLSELPLLTPSESRQLLVDWNASQADFPRESCIHELFEAHALRTPDAVALIADNEQLTYRELNARANALAHHLRSLGVRAEMPVGICLDRSPEAIVSILAVLKAGGAYVPLDPVYPPEWLSFILEDTGAQVLISQRRFSGKLGALSLCVVHLEESASVLAAQPTTNLTGGASAENPAYIIYTSGSTGQPKGVVVEHRNVVHSTWSRMQYYRAAGKNVALIPSIAFDASVAVIFWTLCAGDTISLPPKGAEQNMRRMAEWIERHRVTHWLSVASLYNLLLDQPLTLLGSLRGIIVGGEACSVALVQRHRQRLPTARLYNEYGPTEGSVWSTVYDCTTHNSEAAVPIGRPIANMRAYVLDPFMNPVPVGVLGELYLAGAGVARGYHQRPELTAERFVANPIPGLDEGRLYRTGDLVSYRPDGQIVFQGRTDSQVKLRGYRIELGQIESALATHPAIAQAVVLIRQAENDQKQLVAYVVSKSQPVPSPLKLRRYLRDRIPDYMIPYYFVSLPEIPLTPNGKVDAQALPLPTRAAVVRQRPFVAAENDIETKLVKVWEHIFDFQPIGAEDDFFDLGGDSLLAAGLCARIEQEFGHLISLDVLLERPTIRLLAELLRNPAAAELQCSVVTIQAGGDRPPMFCLPGIGGNVLEFRDLAQQLGPEQTLYGLHPAGLDDGQSPHSTVAEMAAHAIQQMRSKQPHGPYHLVGYSLGGIVAFEMAQQLRAAHEPVALLALLDSRLWSPPVELSFWQRVRLHGKTLWHSSNRGRWHYLRERGRLLAARIRRGNLHGSEEDVVLGLNLSPASRKIAGVHYRAWRSYEPRVYDGQLTLFMAQQSPDLTASLNGVDSSLGWSRWSTKGIEVHHTSATHAEILRTTELQILAEKTQRFPLAACVNGTHACAGSLAKTTAH